MSKTVLIVDDDPTQRRLMQAVLEREGFAVAQADGGEAAVGRIASGLIPDVVILDLVMPRMSGIETLKAMREHGLGAPVVVLTATGGVDTVVVQAMQAGANDFFIKPASAGTDHRLHPQRPADGPADQEVVSRLKKRAHWQRHALMIIVGSSSQPMRMVKALGGAGGEIARSRC